MMNKKRILNLFVVCAVILVIGFLWRAEDAYAQLACREPEFDVPAYHAGEVHAEGDDTQIRLDSLTLPGGSEMTCFPSKMRFQETDSQDEWAMCRVYIDSSGKWILEAEVKNTDNAEAWCEAMCFGLEYK